MKHAFHLCLVAGLAALAAAGTSGCSADAQASPPTAFAIVPAATGSMPEPRAPFDETPITPVESAGASRSL